MNRATPKPQLSLAATLLLMLLGVFSSAVSASGYLLPQDNQVERADTSASQGLFYDQRLRPARATEKTADNSDSPDTLLPQRPVSSEASGAGLCLQAMLPTPAFVRASYTLPPLRAPPRV